MTTILKDGMVYTPAGFVKKDIFISDGKIVVDSFDSANAGAVVDCADKIIVPGFTDVHVHLREPGFFYKETIASGTAAAARGGYTCVCSMPNLNPAPSDMKSLNEQLNIISKDAIVKVIPYGTITREQNGRGLLSDMKAMAPYVCAFTDDGKGVQTPHLMEEAMNTAHDLGKLIVAHCEDETLLDGGYIHKGEYAESHGHKGICSESEWKQAERDVALAKRTNAAYHICHVSTKETVDIVRRAKAEGVDVTCETAPHYLILCDEDLKEDGRFKMNPPVRSSADRAALIAGILDGTIDMIATDHAPHSSEEKSKGLAGSAFGVVGLEISFPIIYTLLVETGIVSLERVTELMSVAPRRRFGFEGGLIEEGQPADLAVIDLNRKFTIDSSGFVSKGRATPFDGYSVRGKTVMTMVDGKIVWEE